MNKDQRKELERAKTILADGCDEQSDEVDNIINK